MLNRSSVLVFTCLVCFATVDRAAAHDDERQVGAIVGYRLDGYRGIWHGQEPTGDQYSYKYSGGLATYTAKHIPLAIYAPTVGKTFFVYGGQEHTGRDRLLAMIGSYDHATGEFCRPTVIHDKNTFDPHDNPALSISTDGHLWVFISGRGRGRAGWIYRSVEPYTIDKFELVHTGEFTYPQPWHQSGRGFLLLMTKYLGGRQLFFKTSADGRNWSEDTCLAAFGGHYQLSWQRDGLVATAFSWHPGGVVNKRTNLYFAQTADGGNTWTTADGTELSLPLTEVHNAALIHDYEAEDRLCYLNDLKFDADGHPVILHVVSRHWHPGPEGGPRMWTVARWDGSRWLFHDVCQSDHNYDTGLLDIDANRWRVLGPTQVGPQPYHTGGEIALWESGDKGRTWHMVRQLTKDSQYNHAYVRPVLNAAADFFALWADGDPSAPSPCRLYFCDRACEQVRQLPTKMTGPTAKPVPYKQ